MLGYISIGYYDVREQEVFSSRSVLMRLIRITMRTAAGCGVKPAGYLARTAFRDMLPEDLKLEKLHLAKGPRRVREIEALTEAVESGIGEKSEWLVIFRPGQGWINEDRVRRFIHELKGIDVNFAVSVKKLPTLANPSWNVNVADRRFLVNGTVRLPVHGGHFHSPLNQEDADLWCRMGCNAVHQRSQDVGALYIDDGLLYAVRRKALRSAENALLKAPFPIRFDPEDGICVPFYERLGIFDVDKEQYLDTGILESVLPPVGDDE